MDTRMLVLGLGAGMIVATLVLGAGNQLQMEPEEKPEQNETTQPAIDWQQEATKADMVVLKKDEYQQQLTQAQEEGAKQKEAELNKNPVVDKVFVYIQPGMGTTDVAILLQAAGVLQDGNRLISLRESWSNPIRSGTYEFTKNFDPQEVLKTIATPPSY
ncbi:hypothetical protein CIG75_11900 [Tumebacillus algifaecis]|uniref:Aminodeoxychorismate lyase n=1 Tax=Tumebacillus algifaecis TaxID=1214604 RepID=A0A223D1Z3_9BACL|nr:hypothetical protein [Tumebacillus algifaecis]ASS75622.1 hypothetical protein CIG75_11900 [Tumebacillus algifaecis]